MGLPTVPENHKMELRKANQLVSRTMAILSAIAHSNGSFILESPADRGNPKCPITYDPELASHGSLWVMPIVLLLAKETNSVTITFAQCMYGSPWQKYTSIMITPDLLPALQHMSTMCCNHEKGSHKILAGRDTSGNWESHKASAYPPKLCTTLAEALPARGYNNQDKDEGTEKPTDSGPRPDGGHFELRPKQTPSPTSSVPPANKSAEQQQNEDKTEEEPTAVNESNTDDTNGPRPDGGFFQLRSRKRNADVDPPTPFALCAIVPNSITGRALQAVSNPPDTVSPRGRKHALEQNREGWLAAEAKELEAHERNHSWTVLKASDVPTGRRIIRMTWVYKIKRDGTHKARLCVMGNTQRPGVDFDQTYSATMRAASLRLLAAISAMLSLSMWRMDFISAYLQGRLEDGEVVYCHMPQGYETTDTNNKPNVLRIDKPIYGLAQAGRRWQRSLFPWLLNFGFTQSQYDPCVFFTKTNDETILLGCYVDDLLICTSQTNDGSIFRKFVKALKSRWEIDEEEEAVDLLNVHFTKSEKGILLHQRPYIESLVDRYAPDGIPLSFQRNWAPCSGDLPELVRRAMSSDTPPDKTLLKEYQSLVGALLYCATNTRPDVAFSVGMLCRAMSKPTPTLLKAALRVLYYLARHADIGLQYESDPSAITAFSDSDLGTQRSTTGWDIRWQRASISYGSKKQNSVATSSCHAEIIAASEAAKEAKFYREFAEELGFPQQDPTPLFVDNTATVNLAYNPEYHNRTKHIDRRHFYVRELVENHTLHVQYVNTADNLADFFTKPLPPKAFFKLRDAIMNVH